MQARALESANLQAPTCSGEDSLPSEARVDSSGRIRRRTKKESADDQDCSVNSKAKGRRKSSHRPKPEASPPVEQDRTPRKRRVGRAEGSRRKGDPPDLPPPISTVDALRQEAMGTIVTDPDESEIPPPPPPPRTSRELLPIGARVTHISKGEGTLEAILPDGRRVVTFAADGKSSRYHTHSLNKLSTAEIDELQEEVKRIDWLGQTVPFTDDEAKEIVHSLKAELEASFEPGDVVRLKLAAPKPKTTAQKSPSLKFKKPAKPDQLDVKKLMTAKSKYDGPVGVVVGREVGGTIGVRLDGQGRTLHYLPEQLNRLPPPSNMGVSLACLRSFREAHKEQLSGLSMDSVWQHLLHPMAEKFQCSLAEVLSESTTAEKYDEYETPLAGPADVYVCCSGAMNFESILDSLEDFETERTQDDDLGAHPSKSFRNALRRHQLYNSTSRAFSPADDIYNDDQGWRGETNSSSAMAKQSFFWFLPFCNDPQREPIQTAPPLWIKLILTRFIGAIGNTCLVLNSWAHPPALSNSWCLLELLSSLTSDARLKVQVAPDEIPPFVHAFAYTPDLVSEAMPKWSPNVSEESMSHRTQVMKVMEQMKLFADSDARISGQMRGWAFNQGACALAQIAPEKRGLSVLQTQLCVLLLEQGLYSEAQHLLEDAAEVRRAAYGADHALTVRSDELRGRMMRMQGRLDEAEELLSRVLRRQEQLALTPASCEGGRRSTQGRATVAVAAIQEELALTYQAKNKLAEAEPLFRAAIAARRGPLAITGSAHGEKMLLRCVNNLASLLRVQAEAKLKEAEPLMCESLEAKRRLLGARHPETLVGISQLGLLEQAKRKPDQAEAHFREALQGRLEVLGRRHPQTLDAIGNLAELLRERGRLGAALHTLGNAVHIAQETLGEKHRVTIALQDKQDRIEAELEKEAHEVHDSDDDILDEPVAEAKTEEEMAAARCASGVVSGASCSQLLSERSYFKEGSKVPFHRLSAEAQDALLRVLSHKNEELIIVFSTADKDHTGSVDKQEFVSALSSMGVHREAAIHELMPSFGYDGKNASQDLHELLKMARDERNNHRVEVQQWIAEEERRARRDPLHWLRRLLGLVKAELWNTLTLPHYDNKREKFVVSEPVRVASNEAEKAFVDMEQHGYHLDTKRHKIDDKELMCTLGLQSHHEEITQASVKLTANQRKRASMCAHGLEAVGGGGTMFSEAARKSGSALNAVARKSFSSVDANINSSMSQPSNASFLTRRASLLDHWHSDHPAYHAGASGSRTKRRVSLQRFQSFRRQQEVKRQAQHASKKSSSLVELFLRAKQAWIRRRATARLVTLDEDCSELRKLSRAYELVLAGLPQQYRTLGESEAMLHYKELLMSVYDALRSASIRVSYFAQEQPGGQPPLWERQRPSLTVFGRVRLGSVIGVCILALSFLTRAVKLVWVEHNFDPATGLPGLEYRVVCERVWQALSAGDPDVITGITVEGANFSVSAEDCASNEVLITYATISLVPPINNMLVFNSIVPLMIFRHNFNWDAADYLRKEVPVLLIAVQSLSRIVMALLTGFDPVGVEMSRTESGRRLIAAELLDATFLFFGMVIFVCMDCCRIKAPRARVALGLTLVLSLLDGMARRSRHDFPLESYPLLHGGTTGNFGSTFGETPKQQFIETFDFSVLSLLAAAVITTLKFPHKLAFIKIHTDLYGVQAEKTIEGLARHAKAQQQAVKKVVERSQLGPIRKFLHWAHARGRDRRDALSAYITFLPSGSTDDE